MKTDPRIRFRTPVLLAAMLSFSGIATSALADRAENAFVVVEGDGVVRLDGKNFAVLGGCSGEETEVTVKPQPGWNLLTPSRVKVKAGAPVPFQVRSKSMEEIVNGTMTTIRIELTAYGCCHYVNGEESAWDAAAEIPVPENKEEEPGAFIHWNIDNDNKSGGGTTDHPGGDYLEHATVSGENDLKKLVCALWSDKWPEVTTGFAVLELKSDSAAIWKSRQKGTSDIVVQPGITKSWNLSDSSERADFYALKDNLYVEGVGAGSCDIEFRFEVNGKSISDMVKYTFISANCERQPSVKERDGIESAFSDLMACEWSVTGAPSIFYNCIAWACGQTNVFITDCERDYSGHVLDEYRDSNGVLVRTMDGYYGNKNGKRDLYDIVCCFREEAGVEITFKGDPQATIVYYSGYHAAKRKGCGCGSGKWILFESKLGPGPRIEHVLEQLSGRYGAPLYFFK